MKNPAGFAGFLRSTTKDLDEDAFFLECTDSLSAELHCHFLAINNKGFCLEVWFPDFLGMALREAHIVAILFAFTG